MKLIFKVLVVFILLTIQPAFAIDLQSAKAKGVVGETPSGYLAAVKSPSADVKALINTVNARRKAKYSEIAASNKTDLKTIELLAGKKAIEKSKPGSYIMHSGSWKKK